MDRNSWKSTSGLALVAMVCLMAAPASAEIIYNVTNDLTHQNDWSLAGTITVSGTGTFTNGSVITAWNLTATKNVVIESLPAETQVCFVTAYPQYAVSAYDFDAVDYLLKPVDPDRLEVAVNRILRGFGSETPQATPPVSESPAPAGSAMFVIPLRDGGAKTVIRSGDILWIEGMGNYSRVCLVGDGKPMLVRRSLAQWENDLPQTDFARLGRSQVIRPECLAMVTWQSRDETVLLFDGSSETLTIGRAAAARLRELTDSRPTE